MLLLLRARMQGMRRGAAHCMPCVQDLRIVALGTRSLDADLLLAAANNN